MADYIIGGGIYNEDVEKVHEISFNKTLIALQLTFESPLKPVIVENINSIQAAFHHFRPTVVVKLRLSTNKIIDQSLLFQSLSDFSIRGIIAQSKFLKSLSFEQELYLKISHQFKTNRSLKSVMFGKESKKGFLDCLFELYKELTELEDKPNVVSSMINEENANTLNNLQSIVNDIKKPAEFLRQGLDKLAAVRKFEFIESVIEGAQNLNPDRKARRAIFLEEKSKHSERSILKETLEAWVILMMNFDDTETIIEHCYHRSENAGKLLIENLKQIYSQIRTIEISYRTLNTFFSNTESFKVQNIFILNAEEEQLCDLDNTRFIDFIRNELNDKNDRLDLRDSYSILIFPGFLYGAKVIHEWARIAHTNMVMLITAFHNLEAQDDVLELFEHSNISGSEIYLSHVIMTCNWLLGREPHPDLEEEGIYLSPAAALGGKLYSSFMSQVAAGKKYGGLNEIDGVRFDLKKSEIFQLEKSGLVPMVKEYGKVMAFSGNTLYRGDNIGLKYYSIVRLFDHISKSLADFMNRTAFQNFSTNKRMDLTRKIVQFLESLTGTSRQLESFKLIRFEQDALQKDKHYLDIIVQPYFPAKNFKLSFEGQKGDDGNDWIYKYSTL